MKALWAAAVLGGLALAARQDDLSKWVTGAEKTKKATKKLTADQAKAIAAAVGCKPEEVETSVAILDALAPIPDKARVLGTVATVKGPKGAIRIGVAVAADEDRVIAVKVLENKDDKAAESKTFADQFVDYHFSDTIRKSPDDLKAALGKAKDSKEAAALLEFAVQMRRLGALWDAALEKMGKSDKGATKDAEEIAKIYEALSKRTGELGFLNDRQKGTLKDDLAKSGKALRDFAPKAGDGNDANAKKQAADIANLCSRCHATMPNRFREAREKAGLGNGYFSYDLDIELPAEGSRELFDAMARGVHKAILQIRDAR